MRRIGFLSVVTASFVVAPSVDAAPPGRSLHARGPSPNAGVAGAAAASAAAAPQLPAAAASRTAADAAKIGRGLPQAAASMSRSAPAQRGNLVPGGRFAAPSGSTAPGVPPAGVAHGVRGAEAVRIAAQQTYEHRLQQATHLEQIAQQNGNEQLTETARRMREQAQQQYDAALERVERMPGAPTTEPVPTEPVEGTPAPETTSAEQGSATTGTIDPAARLPQPQAAPRWRDRFRFASPFGK
jgi:hypothetical protein